VDFRYLNRATPKDEYPMPVVDLLVDSASGNKVISFLDGNAGYNQMFMAKEDVSKSAFRILGFVGLFKWVVVTFCLRNAGAMYQRALNLIFHDLLRVLMEIYINNVVVKSVGFQERMTNLKLSLERMKQYGLQMNPLKCAFGVTSGRFLSIFWIGPIYRTVWQRRSSDQVDLMFNPSQRWQSQGSLGRKNVFKFLQKVREAKV
jgi:hypothetical protein